MHHTKFSGAQLCMFSHAILLYVKRVDVMKRLSQIAREQGEELVAEEVGGHTKVWWIGRRMVTIPRHREISEFTARGIIRKMEEK